MDNAGVELPCTGSLHSPAIILKIQAIFLKIQAVILKIQAIILTKGVRSRILGRLVTWVLDGIDNSWIFHGHWLDRHDPSTLESQTISGFQSIISGCTKISFLDCTRLWCSNLMSERNGWEHGARKNIVFCSQYNTRRKLPVLLCQNNIFLRVFFVICARTFYIFALGLSPYSTMSSNVHIFNYRLPGLWQNPAKLQLSKLP